MTGRERKRKRVKKKESEDIGIQQCKSHFHFFPPDVDTTKDPCQKVKCSRHKVCIAQGYQRAVCVNRKKLEHRWVSVAPQAPTPKTHTYKSSCIHSNMLATQPSLQCMGCDGLGCVSPSATLVIIKLVCTPGLCDSLLFNDKLIHSDNMNEGCYPELAQQWLSQLDLEALKCLCVLCPAADWSSLLSGLLMETVSLVPSPPLGLCVDQTDTTTHQRYPGISLSITSLSNAFSAFMSLWQILYFMLWEIFYRWNSKN